MLMRFSQIDYVICCNYIVVVIIPHTQDNVHSLTGISCTTALTESDLQWSW